MRSRDVVAERCEESRIDRLGLNAIRAGPRVPADVVVLEAPGEAAVGGTANEAVPEASRRFPQVARIGVAQRTWHARGRGADRRIFLVATRVDVRRCAIANG